VQRQVVLMIPLGGIERLTRLDPGHDRSWKHMRPIELGDVGVGNFGLLIISWKDRRAVLGPGIRTLAVELSRVMGYREIYLQDAAVADPLRIEGDAHGFGISGSYPLSRRAPLF
jgi:hypothetical protein